MTARLRYGPSLDTSVDAPADLVDALVAGGMTACELPPSGKLWNDYDAATAFGKHAAAAGVSVSLHAPIAGFMGHAERGKKLNMAFGMLDHSAGIA
jgi:sugar phosphate isomerase/epimerase